MSGAKVPIRAKVASEVLVSHLSDLTNVISPNPLEFAIEMRAKKIISCGTLSKTRSSTDSDIAKACDLVNAVIKATKTDPDVLDTFCDVLDGQYTTCTREVKRSLKDNYEAELRKAINCKEKAATALISVEAGENSAHRSIVDESKLYPDHLHKPTYWVKQTRPLLSPYLPQIGDIVVYFRQGHKRYIKAVCEDENNITNEKLPIDKFTIPPQQCCQVTNVQYIAGASILCSLHLTSMTPSSSQSSEETERITFTVKYRDVDGVPDFLVLKSVYDAAITTSWSAGDRFKSLMKDGYFYGKVLSEQPFDDSIPDSNWQRYRIEWDDNQSKNCLSSWEMERIPTEGESTPNNISQLQAAVSRSLIDETERNRILRGLRKILQLDEASHFQEPVKVEDFPTYYKIVAFPTDLSTIGIRLSNGFYRCKEALLWEVILIQLHSMKRTVW